MLLEWEYVDGAADQFMIIRYILSGGDKLDEQVLARVGGDVHSYKDYTGLPNTLYHYQIVPLNIREWRRILRTAKRRMGRKFDFPVFASAH